MFIAKTIATISATCLITACFASSHASAHHTDSSYWLSLIADCESHGDPWVVNENDQPDGSASYGKYQFAQITWDDMAAKAYTLGLTASDWTQVVPTHAPERIQDILALVLWDGGEGWHHWTNCSIHIGYPEAV